MKSKINEDPFAAYLAGQDKSLFDCDVGWVDFVKGNKLAMNATFNNPVTDFFTETGSVIGNLQKTGFNLAKNASDAAKSLTDLSNFIITLAVARFIAAVILLKK